MACFACGGALLAVGSCRDPTEIELRLSSDFDCAALGASVGTTSISVARDLASITVPTTTIPSCAQPHPNDLGTLVLVPSGDGDDVAIEIVAGLGKEACAVDAPSLAACVVAKRRIHFVKHEHLVLPIDLHAICAGISCDGDLTCVEGQCVSSVVDPGSCQNGTCPSGTDGSAPHLDATAAPDAIAGEGGADGAPTDAARDVAQPDAMTCPLVGKAAFSPNFVDCPLLKPGSECSIAAADHCCGASAVCQPARNPCSANGTVECDETADCAPGLVCCISGSPGNYSASCAVKCNATSHQLCKSQCECAACAVGPCGLATCDNACP